jgi:hypothetical protein
MGSGAAGAAGLYAIATGAGWASCGDVAVPTVVAGVGGPGKEFAEVVLSARGGNCAAMAVCSSCWTTGLIESRCSAGLFGFAGASFISSFAIGKTFFR